MTLSKYILFPTLIASQILLVGCTTQTATNTIDNNEGNDEVSNDVSNVIDEAVISDLSESTDFFKNTTDTQQVFVCGNLNEEKNIVPDFYMAEKETDDTVIYQYSTGHDKTALFKIQNSRSYNPVTYSHERNIFAYSGENGLYLYTPDNDSHIPVLTGSITGKTIDEIPFIDWYNDIISDSALVIIPEAFSPDGKRLLISMGYYEGSAYGVIDVPENLSSGHLEKNIIIHTIPSASYTWNDTGTELLGINGFGYYDNQFIRIPINTFESSAVILAKNLQDPEIEFGSEADYLDNNKFLYDYSLLNDNKYAPQRIALIGDEVQQQDILYNEEKNYRLQFVDSSSFVYLENAARGPTETSIWIADIKDKITHQLVIDSEFNCNIKAYRRPWVVISSQLYSLGQDDKMQMMMLNTETGEIGFTSPIVSSDIYQFVDWVN